MYLFYPTFYRRIEAKVEVETLKFVANIFFTCPNHNPFRDRDVILLYAQSQDLIIDETYQNRSLYLEDTKLPECPRQSVTKPTKRKEEIYVTTSFDRSVHTFTFTEKWSFLSQTLTQSRSSSSSIEPRPRCFAAAGADSRLNMHANSILYITTIWQPVGQSVRVTQIFS